MSPDESLASDILGDDDDPVDVTDASEPRGEEDGDARVDDVSDAGAGLAAAASCMVARLWTERSRSERIPAPPPTGV